MKHLFFSLLLFATVHHSGMAQMAANENGLKAALLSYIQAGDDNDVATLNKVLHKDFRVSVYNASKDIVSILDRATYAGLIEAKKFGGYPRTADFHSIISIGSNMATVNVTLTSPGKPTLKNFFSLVNEKGKWYVLQDFATIQL